MIPCKPSECVPVCLREGMACPGTIVADITDACDPGELVSIKRTIDYFGNGSAFAWTIRISIQHFFHQRRFIHEVSALSQVFLRQLEFHHQGSMRHGAE